MNTKLNENQKNILEKYLKDNNIYERAWGINGYKELSYLDIENICNEIYSLVPDLDKQKSTYISFWYNHICKKYIINNKPDGIERHWVNDTKSIADKMSLYIRDAYNNSKTIDKLVWIEYDSFRKIKDIFDTFGLYVSCRSHLGHLRRNLKNVIFFINNHYDWYKLKLEILDIDKKLNNKNGMTSSLGIKIRVIKCEPLENNKNMCDKDSIEIEDKIKITKQYNGRETIDEQVQRLKTLLENQDGKIYKKNFDEFRNDMKFGDRFSNKHRLKYHIIDLLERIKVDKTFIINEPIFNYEDNTITLYAEIVKPDIEKELEKEQKELEAKLNEAPKLTLYEFEMTYTLICKGRFSTLFEYVGSHTFKAYTETDANKLFKNFIENEIRRYKVKGNKPINYTYFTSSKEPVEPYK